MKYKRIDTERFLNPATDADAYWLGFIAADGNIPQTRAQLTIELADKDRTHLEKFLNCYSLNNPLITKTRNGHTSCLLVVSSTALVPALEKWFITPKKSLTIKFPTHMPDNLMPAFVRGYFDGNGTVGMTKIGGMRIGFYSGSYDFLLGLRETLDRANIKITSLRTPEQGGKVGGLFLSVKVANVERFIAYMYDSATVYLERKYDRFASYVPEKELARVNQARAARILRLNKIVASKKKPVVPYQRKTRSQQPTSAKRYIPRYNSHLRSGIADQDEPTITGIWID